MKAKNRKPINNLIIRMIKANKIRNTVAVIAIALTSTLFTAIFAIGGNLMASVQNEKMRMVGTSAHAGLKQLTLEQYEHIEKSPLIKDISYNIFIAFAQNEELRGLQNEIRYSEAKLAGWNFNNPTTGSMPASGRELACSTITLDMLGIPHTLGEMVSLEFTIDDIKYTEDFILAGFWQGDEAARATTIFLSREYTDSIIEIPQIDANVYFSNSFQIENKLADVISERGYQPEDIATGVNWAYTGSKMPDASVIAIVVTLFILIVFSGYLIIYCVFEISITSDIRFYGLLKTIGTTEKQLSCIVRNQAFMLSMIGIPLGFVVGYCLGYGLTPALMNMTPYSSSAVTTFNPLIFLFSGIFSLLTVLDSCKKPGTIASTVSPVEAVRYTEASIGKQREKRCKKSSILSMAWRNVMRKPKKLMMIIISLSLGMILLNCTYSLVRGFDMNKFLREFSITDFTVTHYSMYEYTNPYYYNVEGVDENVLSAISEFVDMDKLANIYYSKREHSLSTWEQQKLDILFEAYRPQLEKSQNGRWYIETIESDSSDSILLNVYGVGALAIDELSDMPIDHDKLNSGNYVLATRPRFINGLDISGEQDTIYAVGDKVTLTNDMGIKQEFEVLAVVDYPATIAAPYISIPGNIIMEDTIYLDFYGKSAPMMTIFNADEEQIPKIEARLEEYCNNVNSELTYRSRDFYKSQFASLKALFVIMGGTLTFILALIGILNFTNTIFMSITSRRRELAMLQSVGMTGRQMKIMLFSEGAVYALLTVLFSVTIGSVIGRLAIPVIANEIVFFIPNFTIMPTLFAAPVFLVICTLIPLVCYHFMQKVSVVERLRNE